MKRKVLILILLAILALATLWAVWTFVYNKPHKDVSTETTMHSLTVDSLYQSYTASAQISDSLYTGKVIEVTGIPAKFEKLDTLTVAVFVMGEGDFGPQGVRCTFSGTLPDQSFKPGTTLRIKGFCNGYNGEDVILESCLLVL